MSSKVDVQWNIHEHLLTFIVVLHCWHEVDGSSGITTTGLPQAMFLQPGKTQRVTETTSGQHIFGCRQFLSCLFNSIQVVTASDLLNLFQKYSGINTLSLVKVLQASSPILLLLRGFFNHKVWLDKEILHVNPLHQLGTTILLRHVHQNCLCFLILYFLLTLLRYYQR